MGCDISILSRHTLNVGSVETLAVDLSERLHFKIEYGYYATTEWNAILGQDYGDDFVSLGFIEPKTFTKKMRLIDENYQRKELLSRFGDSVFQIRDYWHWYNVKDPIPDADVIQKEKEDMQIAQYFLVSYEEAGEYCYLNIHDEIASSDLHYYTRWWDFCKTIQFRQYFDDKYYQDFRKAVMADTIALGGQKAYFVNDQCKYLEGVGQGEEMHYSWQLLVKHIEEKAGEGLVSISKTVLDIDYQNRIKAMPDHPIAFWDDFEDLK